MSIIEVAHISKSFGRTLAVEDVSFSVEPGETFGLLGPNGAGKTTTIRILLDIFKPDSGRAAVFGGELDLAKKRRIGYLPEERGLYKDIKLEAVLLYLARLKGMDERPARERLEAWLERLDLAAHRSKKVQELSRGMQQKAQIIATLLHEPELIIIDEPFQGLDPVNTRLIKEILAEQGRAGRTIVMSTHQMHQVEAMCQRIVLIHQGRVVLYGAVDEVKRNFAGNAVRVEGQGDFAAVAGVLDARRQDGGWQMALELGADPQAVLRQLVSNGVKIERFEVAEPSLEDIFVSVVQERPAAGSEPGA
ncbi:MAG: ABC transporter ATP-binding protein [Candidatus Promineifilaceae bacterium]